MPKTKTFLTPSEYAVLGLLRQRPAYGYELQRRLAPGQPLGRVCPVEPAMVYAILKSLAGLELIDGEWDSSVYPPKAVYAITDAGEADFQRWLRRPVARLREVRLDFLLKLYFALDEGPALARELLESQIEAVRAYTDELEAARVEAAQRGCFEEIVLDSKISAAEHTRSWLERSLTRIGGEGR
jgi:PadR family transcriptional regulator, regulatory protein AphA